MAERLLFLDIDGVLNSERYYWTVCDRLPSACTSQDIDPDAVARLNRIIDQSNCEVVLSSSWRGKGTSADVFRVWTVLNDRGFLHRFVGATPFLGMNRHVEIGEVVDERRPERFVVLDDDEDAWHDGMSGWGRLVQTNHRLGLQDEHVAQAVEWLSGAAR